MEYEIRPAKAGDGAGINKLRRMPGVFENILGIPSEKEKRNEEFILNMDENNHFFVAVTTLEDGQEEVIGCASLGVYANPRKRHSGGIA